MRGFKTLFLTTALICTLTLSASALSPSQPVPQSSNANYYNKLDLLGDVIERIRKDYVTKPDDDKLIGSANNGMLEKLDPHSSYMDAQAYRDMQQQTSGHFGGLG